jgi:hypothetical protein
MIKLPSLIIKPVGHLVSDHRAHGPKVHGIIGILLKQRRLQDGGLRKGTKNESRQGHGREERAREKSATKGGGRALAGKTISFRLG